jgi:beta-phosphoglucomutase-like phosphatase (HAD superfamily)
MPLRAVIFDFDGVIVDTESMHWKAAQSVLADVGIALDMPDYYERYLGFDDAGMFRAVASDRGVPFDNRVVANLVRRKSQMLISLMDDGAAMFAGAAECVGRCAAEVPLAIASGALRHEIDMILSRIGLRQAFQVIVGAEDAPRSKPAPDPYVRVVELLRGVVASHELTAGDCVAIEDSQWGLESARAAGVHCVAVAHTYPIERLRGADFIARTLDEITVERLRTICS